MITGCQKVEVANFAQLGFGLLISKEFAEKHGGKITVESTEDEGSKFIVRLPYNQ